MATIDDLKQELDELLERFKLQDDIKEAIKNKAPNDEPGLQNLISETNTFLTSISDTYRNYTPHVAETQLDYISKDKKDYDGGTYYYISTLISKQSAKKHDAGFIDLNITRFDNNITDKQDFYSDKLSKIKTTGKSKLITGIIPVEQTTDTNGNTSYQSEFKELLNNSEIGDFNTIVIPLSFNDTNNAEGHAVSLVIDATKQQISLIDQVGKNDNHLNAIKDIIKDTSFKNYTLTQHESKIMDNRHDCAIFAGYINNLALQDTDLQAKITTLTNDPNKTDIIDDFNAKCKDEIKKDLFEEYKNNPLFQLYAQSQHKDLNTISPEDMRDLIVKFADLNSMSVGENTNQDQAHMDPLEAEEIREAIKHANTVLTNNFQEADEDPNFPGHLVFKDAAKPENRIIFASKSQAFVEGDQKSFDELIVAAKKLNRTKVNFGNFESKPEDRAKLYLACLKYDMEIGRNEPKNSELQQYPEWDQIQFIRATKEASKTFTEMLNADKERNEDSEWKHLKDEMDKAKEALNKDPDNQLLQDDFSQKQQAFNNNDKQKAYTEKQESYKQRLEQAKTLSKTSASKDQIKKLPQFSKFKFMDLREGIREARKELNESAEYKDFVANPADKSKKTALEETETYKKYVDLMAELVENDPQAQERKYKIKQLNNNPNRADILTKRDGESDVEFNDRKDAVEKENWEKIIKQRQGETPNDYQTRKNETLQQIEDQKPTRTAQKELNQAVFKKLTEKFNS